MELQLDKSAVEPTSAPIKDDVKELVIQLGNTPGRCCIVSVDDYLRLHPDLTRKTLMEHLNSGNQASGLSKALQHPSSRG